jgi:protein TonB
MIKAKEVSIKNIVVFLAFSFVVSAGYFIARPRLTTAVNTPVFIGEEVVVQRGVKAVTAVRTGSAVKVVTAPVVPPKVAAPLPIIPPAVTFKVLPEYPASALEKSLEGMVVLSVYVGLNGQPEKIETKVSSGIAGMDGSAAKAVSQWRFNPASQGGTAIASWFEIPVRFVIR